MLFNLVSNAIKFTPEGGRVTIGTLRLADAVEISVTDTGIGIAEGDREHLFEEFRQFDSDLARDNRGTGLGLALTKRFVELHGGQIGILSEVGKGSVFTITLPLSTSARSGNGAARVVQLP
jgi:signal transduction histidine kinase